MKQDWTRISTESILDNINGMNVLDKCSAICELSSRKNEAGKVSAVLFKLKHDDQKFWNYYLVSDFAIAALDILGIEKYQGNKEETKKLIDCKLQFD